MPSEGIQLMQHSDILSFEEILEVVDAAVKLGINKIRITGGEPLVRRNIVQLVEQIASRKEISDLSMTTNGILLAQFAQSLKESGLNRVNISLDTINRERFAAITRGGDIEKVKQGIEEALKVGLLPVKLNCVVEKSSAEPDAQLVKNYADSIGVQVRFIRKMDLEKGEFYIVDGGSGGDCSTCNRLRLTANGMVKPCLFNDIDFSVRQHGAMQALLQALDNKPSCGTLNKHGEFYNIGG